MVSRRCIRAAQPNRNRTSPLIEVVAGCGPRLALHAVGGRLGPRLQQSRDIGQAPWTSRMRPGQIPNVGADRQWVQHRRFTALKRARAASRKVSIEVLSLASVGTPITLAPRSRSASTSAARRCLSISARTKRVPTQTDTTSRASSESTHFNHFGLAALRSSSRVGLTTRDGV